MDKKQSAPPARKTKQDRWGFRPVRAGYVRGRISNVRQEIEVCEFGDLYVVTFDLFADDKQPPIPVRMTGTYFRGRVSENRIVDVRDPDPSARPIVADRLLFPPSFEDEVVAFYPGRDTPPPPVSRFRGMLVVFGPLGLALAAVGLYFVFRQ